MSKRKFQWFQDHTFQILIGTILPLRSLHVLPTQNLLMSIWVTSRAPRVHASVCTLSVSWPHHPSQSPCSQLKSDTLQFWDSQPPGTRLTLSHQALWEEEDTCFPEHFLFTMCMHAKSLQLCLTLQSQGLQPARLLCPCNSPGKNTGVSCHALQGIFPTRD